MEKSVMVWLEFNNSASVKSKHNDKKNSEFESNLKTERKFKFLNCGLSPSVHSQKFYFFLLKKKKRQFFFFFFFAPVWASLLNSTL